MTRTLAGPRTGFGARQGIAFGLSLLCAFTLFAVTAGPARAAPPGAPTNVSATAGQGQATVTWTAPAGDGGFTIDSYTVTASGMTPATSTVNGSTLSATVTGLTNGTSYTFTVTAHNADGDGLASSPSNAVTPATVPGAPLIGTATAGQSQATVTWTAPGTTGGSPITSYTVTSTPGGKFATTNGSTLSTSVQGLTNGIAYTFTVRATNAVGNSAESGPSNSVTPAATVPGAPIIGTATPGYTRATVTWTAPDTTGGSPITSYTVTATPGGQIATTNGTTRSATVQGLINGIDYTFTVRATNAVGNSAESGPSNSVRPAPGVPGAPTGVSASPGNASAVVSWTAPDNGGSAIVSYTVTTTATGSGAVPPPVTVGGQAAAAAVNGLTNGELYRFAVRATNGFGTGPATLSDAVAPGTIPGMPTGVTASPGNGSVTVTWLAPVGQGGSPVTSYTVTARLSGGSDVAVVTVASPSTELTVGGLTNGLSYTFRVTATNAAGEGPASAPVGPVTPADVPVVAAGVRSGYWMVEQDGRVYNFGDAVLFGDPRAALGTAQAVDLEPTPSGNGYWVIDDLGRVYGYGDALSRGNVAGLLAGERAISVSATPSGAGYWIFTTRGRVVPFGDATFHGDMAGVTLNGPIRDSIPTTSGRGYYMVASDGGIFAFGDAVFYGSMGAVRLNAPVQSLVPDADGVGYWLVAADGGIFAFQAPFRGSMGATTLNQPITGMVRFGNGYLMVGTDGGIFNFSDRLFLGSLGASPPARPIVSVAALAG